MVKAMKLPPMVGVLLGISFYEFSDTVLFLIQPLIFPTLLRIVGMIITLYYLNKATFHRLNGGISTLYNFMIIWTVFMLLRGSLIGNFIPGGSSSIIDIVRRALLNSFGAFSFFLPLLAIMEMKMNSFFYLRRFAIFFCVISLLMTFIDREQIAMAQLTQGMTTIQNVEGEDISVRTLIHAAFPGFGLILLALFCNNFIKGFVRILFPIAIFVFFVTMAIGGGRGDTIFNLVYLILFFFIIIKYPIQIRKASMGGRVANRITSVVLGVGFVFLLTYMYSQTEIFDYVLERAFGDKTLSTDIRSESREILVRDFTNDFNSHPLDWVWGRGVNGSYETQHLGINGRRAWMEWGYIYLVLKGGVVYLFLFVFCFLHAAYVGFFKSSNSFSKCLACMCLVAIFDLASTNSEPQFTTQFVMSWISFGLLERKEIRKMSDDDFYGYFNVKNYERIGS